MMGREQWTYVDDLNKPPRLRRGDACFYYLVYTPHAGYGISAANGIVLNYKIPIGGESGLRNRPQRRQYKDAAIAKYAEAIVDFIEGKRTRATGEELAVGDALRRDAIEQASMSCPLVVSRKMV